MGYDTDYAIIDVCIALRLCPDWDWALYVLGMLLWDKANPKLYRSVDPSWRNLAKAYLENSIRLSQSSQIIMNCREILAEIQ